MFQPSVFQTFGATGPSSPSLFRLRGLSKSNRKKGPGAEGESSAGNDEFVSCEFCSFVEGTETASSFSVSPDGLANG